MQTCSRRDFWLLSTATVSGVLAAAGNPDFDAFLEKVFRDWVREDPEMATWMRVFDREQQEELDARLTDISDEAAHRRVARAEEALRAARRFDRRSMSAEQQFSADLLEYELQDVIDEDPFFAYRFPINQFRGVQLFMSVLFSDLQPMQTPRDAENYLVRLRAVGGKIDQASAMMKDRAKQNIRLPGFISEETVNQMQRFTAPDPAKNVLAATFARKVERIEGLDDSRKTAMKNEAVRIVGESVYPAYRRAADSLATMNANASKDAGLWRFGRKGEDAYAFGLRRFTTTTLTADQIHRIGFQEVARISAEMEPLFRKLGYTSGDVQARFRKLEDDHSYAAAAGGGDVRARILADYAEIIAENDRRSGEAFDMRPKSRCIVQRIPEFQEANAAANYSGPPADGSRPGIFRVPLRGPNFPKPGMRTLAAHEAIPGHHFQLALQVEMKTLPSFRRQRAFTGLSAFSEGWGLYAERLAGDLGWYKDDAVSDLGRLNAELFRARRLVADTGLHAKKWTREQAVAYGIPQSEVDRYVMMPGQACSYKIGQMKILELREESRKALGRRFDLKQFHNAVLGNGTTPLVLLERSVRDWQKRATPA